MPGTPSPSRHTGRDLLLNPAAQGQQLALQLQRLRAELTAPPDWTVATLEGAWAVVGGRDAPAYWKDGLGIVHLRGGAQSGISGSTVFTLPVGSRPGGTFSLYAVATNGSTSPGFAIVFNNGAVELFYSGAGEIGLGGITFPAEN